MASSFGEDTDDLGAAFDLAVNGSSGLVRVQFGPARSYRRARLSPPSRPRAWATWGAAVGDPSPLGSGRLSIILGEGGGDEGRDSAPALSAGMR
jgi:hypothetical protein